MKRRDLIKKSALVTGAVATPVALDAGNSDALTNPLIDEQTLYYLYGTLEHEGLIEFTNHQGGNEVITIDEETSKIVMRNLGNAHIVDYYKNYKFILEAKFNVIDFVRPKLFNTVMQYVFDYDDMQDDIKYEDEEYNSDMVSRIHHAWDIARTDHQDLIRDYSWFYQLVAWNKPELSERLEWDRPDVVYDENDGIGDYLVNKDFMREVDRMHDFLNREGLLMEYSNLFHPWSDFRHKYDFMDSWAFASYIEFTNNNVL